MKNINWGAVINYVIAALAILDGFLGYVGVHVPGVTVDPATAFAFGIGVFGGHHVNAALGK